MTYPQYYIDEVFKIADLLNYPLSEGDPSRQVNRVLNILERLTAIAKRNEVWLDDEDCGNLRYSNDFCKEIKDAEMVLGHEVEWSDFS